MKTLFPNALCLAMTTIFLSQTTLANPITSTSAQPKPNATQVEIEETEEVADLGTLKVTAKTPLFHRKKNEITGLGKIIKTSDNIDKELILNIRDLTRYDPGISVVEQGRGASSGYSMRGVDRNRVAMSVDGLTQAQSYLTLKSSANGGAMSEIEYENVRAIELSKGASSSQYGSGALGGAVGLATKTADDVLKGGQAYGVQTKTAYASKTGQFMQSVAGAGRLGAVDMLAIYTHRNGHESKVHSAANNLMQSYSPLTGFFNEYDEQTGNRAGGYYILKDDCPTLDCTPKARAKINNDNVRPNPNLTGDAKRQADQMPYPTYHIKAKDYTGENRIAANPLDYQSNSWLFKIGYQLDKQQSLGAVAEYSRQRYDSRDMSLPSYYTKADIGRGVDLSQNGMRDGLAVGNGGITKTNNPLDGLVFDLGNGGFAGAKYARTRYFDERHHKGRFGLNYRYENPNKDSFADTLTASLDRQTIHLNTRMHEGRCSELGNEHRCRASLDKEWSHYQTEKNHYSEQLTLAQMNWQKAWQFGNYRHRLQALTGLGATRSVMAHGDMYIEYANGGGYEFEYTAGRNGSFDKPYVYKRTGLPTTLQHIDVCNSIARDNRDCRKRIIKARQWFFGVNDHLKINDLWEVGAGVRYDLHSFKSTDEWTKSGKYHHWSWNAGVNFRPTDLLTLSYRASNGFRVPAFYELYGVRTGLSNAGINDDEKLKNRPAPKAEKSMNHEFGIGLKGRLGHLEMSVFDNRYDGLLARADDKATGITDFYNTQNVHLQGINVLGKLDWYGVSDRLPDGLYSNLAYNQVKVKDRSLYEGFSATYDPILDAVQPARLVAGIGYDRPDGRYGVNLTGTYSWAKNNNELFGNQHWGDIAVEVGGKRSRAWYAYDLIGYYNMGDKYTIRGGIYNLANRKYSTWESVRQSAPNAVNASTGQDAKYAAAGRNFVLSFEAKF